MSQADIRWSISGLLAKTLVMSILGWAAGRLLAPDPLFSSIGAVMLGCTPWVYVSWKRSRRLHALERQLPDALDLMSRALRAGHAFSAALKMAGEEMPGPIAAELRLVHEEVTYGVSLAQALNNLAERIPLMDVRYFVVAVLIQRESGGNLTEILGGLSRLIRERFKLLDKVRVLSAEGRLSAWVMGLLPFALAALLNVFNPKFMSPLWTDPIGIAILKYVLMIMAIGALILRRITRIQV